MMLRAACYLLREVGMENLLIRFWVVSYIEATVLNDTSRSKQHASDL